MFSNSFSWWLFNLGIAIAWLAGSIVTGNYFLAIGALLYILLAMLVELPDAVREESSAEDEEEPGLFPPA